MIGACVLLVVAMAALTAPWIAPYDPAEPDFADTMSPPTFQHLLGTDDLGRDQLSRILFGARVALTAGLLPVGLACVVGVSLGLIAGYAGGKIDKAIVAFLDAVLAFPDLVLIIAITAALGPNLRNALIAIAFTSFPGFARVVRAQVMSLNEQDFVIAARAVGARDYKIVGRHILPNVVAPVIVIASLAVGGAILAEAALSYLGLGVQPPQASWGQMVNTGSSFLRIAPWMAIVPGMAIFITVLATNFLGDGLRDALDPRLRNSG
ncbi:MAG: ABC transporter permease [Thermomicrobiales bacterium]|nr:ABC transporter permease [Thermomicrobiales bacterium]